MTALDHEGAALATADRLFDELAAESADPPGVTRDTFGGGEAMAHRLLAREGDRLGLERRVDAIGNLYLTLPGADRTRPAVMLGSHLDSVPHGGNFDGAAGVLAGLATLERLVERGQPPAVDVTVMAIRAEEMIWFPTHYLGSRAAFGRLPADTPDRIRRADTGQPLAAHMHEQGFDPDTIRRGRGTLDPARIAAFVELHIEQGPHLVEDDLPVGIVTAIRGNRRYRFGRVTGVWDHAGGVPRRSRHDAVLAAVAFAHGLDERWAALEADGHDLVATLGEFWTPPERHGITKIPGELRFTLDIRSEDEALLWRLDEELRADATRLGAERWVTLDLGDATHAAPALMDESLRTRLHDAAARLDVPCRAMPSGGGHDAAVFAGEGVPTAMVFVRNPNGSHNPDEAMALADFAAAWRVLAATVDGLVDV